MIRVFNPKDKNFTTNGEAVIIPLKARVKNEDNGDFYLDLSVGYQYNDFIQADNIIVCDTPQGEQAFRIREIEKTKNKLEVRAWHLYYDSDNYLIADRFAQNATCFDALQRFNAGTDNPSPFITDSDVVGLNSYRCVRTSLNECIQTVLERWGGHLKRDNFNIGIYTNIGTDNGITIAYRKNLQELTASYDFSTVVTKLMPVGKEGILLDELYLYSDITYDIPYTKAVTFEQDIEEDDFKNKDGDTDIEAYHEAIKRDLKKQALKYLSIYCYPTINYTLKGNPEVITDIGDIIEVIDERIGVKVMTQVISYEYDAILHKYTSLEFGNFTNTLNNLMANISNSTQGAINNAMNSISVNINSAVQEAYNKVWASLQSSYCIFKGDSLLIVDTLPSSSAVNVIKIDKNGISFSNTGIEGTYQKAWSIADVLDFSKLTTENFDLSMIAGGVLALHSSDAIEVYDSNNVLIGRLNSSGLELFGVNVSTALNGKQDTLTAGNNITINNNVISANNASYSSTEKVIGTFNGYDLYQQTIEITASSNWDSTQNIGIYNANAIIKKITASCEENGVTYMLPYVSGANSISLSFSNGDITLNVAENASFASGSKITIILEYIK